MQYKEKVEPWFLFTNIIIWSFIGEFGIYSNQNWYNQNEKQLLILHTFSICINSYYFEHIYIKSKLHWGAESM